MKFGITKADIVHMLRPKDPYKVALKLTSPFNHAYGQAVFFLHLHNTFINSYIVYTFYRSRPLFSYGFL